MSKFVDIVSIIITMLLGFLLIFFTWLASFRMETMETILCFILIYIFVKNFDDYVGLVKFLMKSIWTILWTLVIISLLFGWVSRLLNSWLGSTGNYITIGMIIVFLIARFIMKTRRKNEDEYEDDD